MKWDESNDVFVTGTSCWVRVGTSASDADKIGYVDSFDGSKAINLQSANVIGETHPVSIDPMGTNVTLSLTGFLAKKEVYQGTKQLEGKGTVSLASFNPNDADFKSNTVITKFPYIDFFDEKTGTVLAAFNMAISSQFRISGNAGSYVKANISMQAITMSSGDDFLGQ